MGEELIRIVNMNTGSAVLTGRCSSGEDVTIPFTPQALAEGLRKRTLLPGLFLCFLEMHFLRDFTVFGGFYQPIYLAQMQRGLVKINFKVYKLRL